MTPPESKKPPRSTNTLRAPPSSSPSKSPIATPPRAALGHRERAKHESNNDTASTKSTKSATGTVNSDDEDASSLSAESAKDKRIKELEAEMGKMESEFEKELTLLSHKLTNESETSQFWQQKHSSLHQTFLKTDTDLRLLRSSLSAQEDRDREIKTRISSLMLDRDAFREAYNEAMGELKVREGEVRELQGQIRGLKNWVSSSGRVGEQVADEVFGEGMGRLGGGVQNWGVVNFRRCRVDTEKASEAMKERLLQLIPTYESLAATSKIHLVQSLVSRLLVEEIFQAYFVGLSKGLADELERVEKYLSGFGPVESINTWRSTTLAILRKEAPEKLKTETAAIVESVVNQMNTIMASISDIQPSDTRDQSLRALINSAIELSRLLRVQKASFTVVMPSLEDHQRTIFDPDSMEDIGGEDEDTLSEREIRCVTFPGIVKAGDENGERGYLRNVVAKIRVLCAPD